MGNVLLRSSRILFIAAPLSLVATARACEEEMVEPQNDRWRGFPLPPLAGLEVIYNDRVRNAAERTAEYAQLFPPEDPELSFVFPFQPEDVGNGGIPESWREAGLEVNGAQGRSRSSPRPRASAGRGGVAGPPAPVRARR